MKVFVDTNVILEYVLLREPTHERERCHARMNTAEREGGRR